MRNSMETSSTALSRSKIRGVHSIKSLLIIVLLFNAVLIGSANAATYYLDAVNGDDSNPGTSEVPGLKQM